MCASDCSILCLFLCCRTVCIAGEGGAVREHKTSFHAISRVIRSEGVLGLYNGWAPLVCSQLCALGMMLDRLYRLSAGLLRQATYSTTRLGIYQSLYDKFTGWVSTVRVHLLCRMRGLQRKANAYETVQLHPGQHFLKIYSCPGRWD